MAMGAATAGIMAIGTTPPAAAAAARVAACLICCCLIITIMPVSSTWAYLQMSKPMWDTAYACMYIIRSHKPLALRSLKTHAHQALMEPVLPILPVHLDQVRMAHVLKPMRSIRCSWTPQCC